MTTWFESFVMGAWGVFITLALVFWVALVVATVKENRWVIALGAMVLGATFFTYCTCNHIDFFNFYKMFGITNE